MAPPRTIEGTAGSRIRLIFGATGSDWLLIMDEDDGDRAWQSHYWSGNIPHKVTTQCNNCTNKGRDVKDVDFGPTGAWYVHGVKPDGSGGYSWWGGSSYTSDIQAETNRPHKNQVAFGSADNYGPETCVVITGTNGYACRGNVDCDLSRRIKRINTRKKEIKKVRLFSGGAYFVWDDEGTEWKNVGIHCSKELKKVARSGCVEEVAVAIDKTWAVLRSDMYVTSNGVDEELKTHLARFYREHRERKAKRNREIRDHQRIEQAALEAVREAIRERQEREERERREAQEREERERREREERQERQRREQEAREQAERAAREEEEKQVALVTRVSVLERKLEERLMDEAQSIQAEEELLQKRKRSLLEAIDEMPPERRARIPLASSASGTANSNDNQCVVCHDNRPNMALVPCGHVCLCETCSGALVSRPQDERLCPLCRGGLQSALKIYLPS